MGRFRATQFTVGGTGWQIMTASWAVTNANDRDKTHLSRELSHTGKRLAISPISESLSLFPSLLIPCPRRLLRPSLLLILSCSLTLPWLSTPRKLGMISATTHSPTGSIVAIAPILSSIYFTNKPRHLKNSGEAMLNCSSGSNPSSTCYMPSRPT